MSLNDRFVFSIACCKAAVNSIVGLVFFSIRIFFSDNYQIFFGTYKLLCL